MDIIMNVMHRQAPQKLTKAYKNTLTEYFFFFHLAPSKPLKLLFTLQTPSEIAMPALLVLLQLVFSTIICFFSPLITSKTMKK